MKIITLNNLNTILNKIKVFIENKVSSIYTDIVNIMPTPDWNVAEEEDKNFIKNRTHGRVIIPVSHSFISGDSITWNGLINKIKIYLAGSLVYEGKIQAMELQVKGGTLKVTISDDQINILNTAAKPIQVVLYDYSTQRLPIDYIPTDILESLKDLKKLTPVYIERMPTGENVCQSDLDEVGLTTEVIHNMTSGWCNNIKIGNKVYKVMNALNSKEFELSLFSLVDSTYDTYKFLKDEESDIWKITFYQEE